MILFSLGSAFSTFPVGAQTSRPPSLCAAAEVVVFGCRQGAKIVSLCAAPGSGGSKRTQLRYLFGAPGKIDLEIAQTTHPEAFTSGVAGLSGGGIDYVRVRNGDYAYVVYTGQTSSWSQDGWIVESRNAAVSHHICKQVATGEQVWGPVYSAKLAQAPDSTAFRPPDWTGTAPPRHIR